MSGRENENEKTGSEKTVSGNESESGQEKDRGSATQSHPRIVREVRRATELTNARSATTPPAPSCGSKRTSSPITRENHLLVPSAVLSGTSSAHSALTRSGTGSCWRGT